MTDDPQVEIKAMGRVSEALEPLDHDARVRVLRWAADRYGVGVSPAPRTSASGATSGGDSRSSDDTSLAELVAAARPANEADRALVVAYWLQYVRGAADFDAQSVNSELKHLGHRVANITRALDQLKERSPQLVVQLRKSGSSKQARKTYKVTLLGKTTVERMLTGPTESAPAT